MTALLIATSLSEFAVIATLLLFFRHRDRRIERDLNAAIGFALSLRDLFRASIFLRAFHDGDIGLLETDFRDWFDYRDDVYAAEGF